jgi:hypothetical protein
MKKPSHTVLLWSKAASRTGGVRSFMKIQSTTILLVWVFISVNARAQDICHFTKVNIPRNEARLLELANVIEFRCECVLPPPAGDSQFVAERYQEGKCVSRQLFAIGKYGDSSQGNYKGIISFGWQMNDQKLAGVHDTGFFHLPGFANLPGFDSSRPSVWAFFKDSQAETRTSKGAQRIELYPVIGIRGAKARTFSNGLTDMGQRTVDLSSLPQEKLTDYFKTMPDAVIIYLSFGSGNPDLDYDKH